MKLVDINGVGPATAKQFAEVGVNEPKDLLGLTEERVQELADYVKGASLNDLNEWIKEVEAELGAPEVVETEPQVEETPEPEAPEVVETTEVVTETQDQDVEPQVVETVEVTETETPAVAETEQQDENPQVEVMETEPQAPEVQEQQTETTEVAEKSMNTDEWIDDWCREVGYPLVENGHSRRSVVFRAAGILNPENARQYTLLVDKTVSLAANIKAAHEHVTTSSK